MPPPVTDQDIARVQGFIASVVPWVIAGSALANVGNWSLQASQSPALERILPLLLGVSAIMGGLALLIRRTACSGRVNATALVGVAYVTAFSLSTSLVAFQIDSGVRFSLAYCGLLATGAVFFWPRWWHFALGTTAALAPSLILVQVLPAEEAIRSLSTQFGANCVVLCVVMYSLVRRATRRAALRDAEIAFRASHDGLTGVYNRSHWMDAAARELQLAAEAKHPISLLVIDVDHFKTINDRHGHESGDRVLTLVATVLRGESIRRGVAGRLGGDEFLLLMPGLTVQDAGHLADVIRADFASLTGTDLTTTLSVGVAEWRNEEAIRDLIARADASMYENKRSSREPAQIHVVSLPDPRPTAAVRELDLLPRAAAAT